MSVILNRYPLTPDEFYKSRLPGVWEEERAGRRMKLPTPETWETQVSLRGNKAETWQDLLGELFSGLVISCVLFNSLQHGSAAQYDVLFRHLKLLVVKGLKTIHEDKHNL